MSVNWRQHANPLTGLHVCMFSNMQPRQFSLSIKPLSLTVLQRAQTYNITVIMPGFSVLLYLKRHTENVLAGEIKEAQLLWQKNIFTVSAHLAPIHHSNLDFILARRKLDGIHNITASS